MSITDVRVQVPPRAPNPTGRDSGGSPRGFNFIRYARVVELADSLDSGSSVHYGRAGSSPASRTRKDSRKTVSLVGEAGLDLHFRHWRKLWFGSVKLSPATVHRTVAFSSVQVPSSTYKRKDTQKRVFLFLVGEAGLEPARPQ